MMIKLNDTSVYIIKANGEGMAQSCCCFSIKHLSKRNRTSFPIS